MKPALRAILLTPPPAIYVDSVNGNDANSGKTKQSAFQTVAAIPTQYAGMRIRFARGSTFRERFTATANNLNIDAYGVGNAPVFDCADVIANASFAKTGGFTNLYEAVVAVEGTHNAAAANWASMWVDGVRLTQAASQAACDATPGTYYPSSTASNTPTYYVHPPGSTDATSDGKVYEYAARSTGVDTFSVTGCTIRNVHTKRNYQSYGSLTLGQGCSAYDCRASEGNTHNVFLRGTAWAERVTADEGYAYGSDITLFVNYETNGAGMDVRYTNCTATMTVANPDKSTGWYGHTSGTSFGTITFQDCTSTGCNNGIAGFNATLLSVSNFSISGFGASGFAAVKPGSNCTIRGLTATAPVVSGDVVLFAGPSITVDADGIDATLSTVNGTTGVESTSNDCTLILTNSTFRGPGVAMIRMAGTGWNVTNNNNTMTIFANTARALYLTGTGGTYVGDNNDYGGVTNRFSTAPYQIGASSYDTLALWQAATGQDANSVA